MTEPDERAGAGRESEALRSRGVSPVVEGRVRSRMGMAAGFAVILAVVGFLLLTGGSHGKPKQAQTAPPVLPPKTAFPPEAPSPPPLPPLTSEEQAAGFPQPPVPGKPGAGGQAGDNARQKEEARMRSPMLVYDASGQGAAAAPAKPMPPDPLASLLAAQLQNANSKPDEQARTTPAEGYAERTQAFAKDSADRMTPEAAAHRITLSNRIAEGKMMAATLETAISSDLPGRLRAVVTSDVWSEDGTRRLIKGGSRLTGEYRSGLVRGQTRVFVIWTRLLQPDGTDLAIGSPGTDDLGRAGLTGAIDRHFAERFGAAFLLSLIGSATTASQGGNTFVINTSQGFGQVAQESLQDSINIPPTIYVEQGAPVQVFVARDLVFDAAVARQ